MITDRIERHKVLLPFNHKNYNFRGKKNKQVMKNILRPPRLLPANTRQKHKSKRGRRHVTTSLNVIGWYTAPFNNMRALRFKSQTTNAFFASVNQMFGGSSQLPTTAERTVIKSLCTVQTTKQRSAVVISWEEPQNTRLTAAKNAFVSRPSNVRVRMSLKSTINYNLEYD